jgi:hypothetical protein
MSCAYSILLRARGEFNSAASQSATGIEQQLFFRRRQLHPCSEFKRSAVDGITTPDPQLAKQQPTNVAPSPTVASRSRSCLVSSAHVQDLVVGECDLRLRQHEATVSATGVRTTFSRAAHQVAISLFEHSAATQTVRSANVLSRWR